MDTRTLAAGLAGLALAFGGVVAAHAQPSDLPSGHPDTGATADLGYNHFRVGTLNVKSLIVDGDTLWFGTSGGLGRYDVSTDKHALYGTQTGLLSDGILHLSRHRKELWVGTYGGGLSILDIPKGTWRDYNIPNGMGDAFVYDVLHTRSGDTWIATWSGVNRVRGGKLDRHSAWDLFTVESTGGGLPNDWVYGLAEGRNGEVWLATEGGLARFARGKWTHWTHADGLGAPFALVKDYIDQGRDPGDQSRHHAQQKQEQGLEGISAAYNPNYIVALAVDHTGTVWAGTWGAGLSRFDGKRWETLTVLDGLPSNHINTIKVQGKTLWIGTSKGLVKFDGRNVVVYKRKDGLYGDIVYSFAAGKTGTWVGSFGGVARFRKPL
jgi:ligand-binding sensor domain-containing protein